ncbi:MAG: ABC transporter permease [Anaerolineaceae bacterium 4572_5.1]|nr:MAG: ABC transporter permease [Anaerolineaceae bacterium 4572_5.1]
MSKYRFIVILLLLAGFLILSIILSLGVGAVYISPERVVRVFMDATSPDLSASDITIVRDLRLARVLLAALVGAGLGTAGAAFQALFRNPLADPYVIGASGGAALGATLAITMGLTWNMAGFGPIPLAAFVGSALAVLVVYTIAGGTGGGSVISLLLAGAALSTVLSSIVSLLMLVSDQSMHQIFSWLMGGFGGRSWTHLWSSGPYLLLGVISMWFLARPLDALACGDEMALTIGLPLPRARGAVVIIATLITAAAVSAAGIIGFVGLVAPHIARLLFGASHHRLIPSSALIGALLTLLADDLARTALAPIELPVGIITSLVGGVFFLYLLKSRQTELRGG